MRGSHQRLDLTLYAILDPDLMTGTDPVAAASAAVAGGTTALQYRAKIADTRTQIEHVRALRAALPSAVPVIVNDRVDVALAAGADGVHLGQTDMAATDARRLLGSDALIGITIHAGYAVDDAGAPDYAGLGPVFATSSKDPGDPPLQPAGLAKLAASVRAKLGHQPLCGIAGINLTNAGEVIRTGSVDGIAVIGAVFRKQDVKSAAEELRAVVDAALREGATA